jgi:predicted transcriptional regulator
MDTTHDSRFRKELIDSLTTTRDRARVQLHLLSLEAKQRWRELESKLDSLQSKIERDEERLSDSAINKVRELTQAVKDLLHENGGVGELTTRASQLMKPARSCRSSDTLNEPARLMWEFDCGVVPVVNDAGGVVGIITDRDICMAVYTRGQPLSALKVESAMCKDVAVASPRDSLETITQLMRRRQIRRVPIVDGGRLAGIVALADITRHLQSEAGFSAMAGVELARTLAAISECRPGISAAAE